VRDVPCGAERDSLIAVGHPYYPGWGPGLVAMVLTDDAETDWGDVRGLLTETGQTEVVGTAGAGSCNWYATMHGCPFAPTRRLPAGACRAEAGNEFLGGKEAIAGRVRLAPARSAQVRTLPGRQRQTAA
jgi:hypothetical protein